MVYWSSSYIYVIKEQGISHKEQRDRYSEIKKSMRNQEVWRPVSAYVLHDLG